MPKIEDNHQLLWPGVHSSVIVPHLLKKYFPTIASSVNMSDHFKISRLNNISQIDDGLFSRMIFTEKPGP